MITVRDQASRKIHEEVVYSEDGQRTVDWNVSRGSRFPSSTPAGRTREIFFDLLAFGAHDQACHLYLSADIVGPQAATFISRTCKPSRLAITSGDSTLDRKRMLGE
jgi:hypothetical protein